MEQNIGATHHKCTPSGELIIFSGVEVQVVGNVLICFLDFLRCFELLNMHSCQLQ
jgi:hypothetical protein